MPTQTVEIVDAYSFCPDGRCPGYTQKPVKGRRVHTSFSYVDNGGDWPGEERSVDHVFFIGDEHPTCEHCGSPLHISEQERPEYARISGQDPMRIFDLDQDTRVRDLTEQNLRRDAEMADLRAQLAEMRAEQAEAAPKRTTRKAADE